MWYYLGMKRKLPTQEVLDFLKKNDLKTSDLMKITGYGKTQVYEWQDKNVSESKMPWEIWLLLNALFNRDAPFITEIICNYGTAETSSDMELPELRKNARKEIDEKIEALKTLKYLEQEFELIMKEESINHIHAEHLARIKDLYYSRRGIHGVRIRNKKVYEQMRKAEEVLNIETAIIIDELEELNDKKSSSFFVRFLEIYDEYTKQRHKKRFIQDIDKLEKEFQDKKDCNFVIRLLEIYDGYIEQLEEARSENYYRALIRELDAKKKENLQEKGAKKKNYLLNTLKQKEEIEVIDKSSPFTDKDIVKDGIITPLYVREHSKKSSENRKK